MTKTAFQEISALRRNAREFETFWDRYEETIKDSRCDKHAARFGGDNRFSNFRVSTFFDSHTGYYGNSACSNFGRFDDDLANKYMTQAMNNLSRELFSEVARLMKADAAKMVGKAREEVDAMNAALDACLSETDIAAE